MQSEENQVPPNDAIMKKIYTYGTYYNPASSHYGNDPTGSRSANRSVMCDRCYRKNLNICIGYDRFDLCLSCVETVANNIKLSERDFKKERGPVPTYQFDPIPGVMSFMEQSQFKPSTNVMSYMEQNQFNS